MTTKKTSIKPHLDKWRTQISSIEADARLTPSDKAKIFQVVEGLIQVPSLRWSLIAKEAKEENEQS